MGKIEMLLRYKMLLSQLDLLLSPTYSHQASKQAAKHPADSLSLQGNHEAAAAAA